MFLNRLSVVNFRNIGEVNVQLSNGLNSIVGRNGSGKTTLLDAIYYMCMTKSALGTPDPALVRKGEFFFRIQGDWTLAGQSCKIECAFGQGEKKIFKMNDHSYDRLSAHVGKLPVVMIAPDDMDLVREGSEVRRKFMDGIISQFDAQYLQALLRYNHLLKQRNAYLKSTSDVRSIMPTVLDAYDASLLPLMSEISAARQRFVQSFRDNVQKKYQWLAQDSAEEAELQYESEVLGVDFEKRYLEQRSLDIKYQRTTMGVHLDDLGMYLNNELIRKTGSQGQKKTFVIALRLAQFELLLLQTGHKPLVLLDDILEKLDEVRLSQLAVLFSQDYFGQTIITSPQADEILKRLNASKIKLNSLVLEGGRLKY